MSLRSVRLKKTGTPRAMPVETILTRYKSAQQKKQCDEKNKKVKQTYRNKKKIEPNKNSLLINNTTDKRTQNDYPDKLTTNQKKYPIQMKYPTQSNVEYYPDKLKRKLINKKIVLAPKHNSKIIGDKNSVNKRKLRQPRKGTNGSAVNLSISEDELEQLNLVPTKVKELSIVDMITLIEDNGSLDEEDFLEILTCPSPVWWEDPPDEMEYIEEPIFRIPASIDVPTDSPDNIHNPDEPLHIDEKNTNATDIDKITLKVPNQGKNFIDRRRKLENLLNNIKNKTKIDLKHDLHDNDAIVTENDKDLNREKTSDSLDDSLGVDDALLNDLENIEIPIATGENTANDSPLDSKEICDTLNNNEPNEEKSNVVFENEVTNESKIDNELTNSIKSQKNRYLRINNKKIHLKNILNEDIVKNEVQNEPDRSSELVTVYKIISNDSDVKNLDKDTKQINCYYKKCKNIRKTKNVNSDLCNSTDSFVISDSDVKYCKKCTSIFDTEDCRYCIRKATLSDIDPIMDRLTD